MSQKIRLNISGMNCVNCSSGIEKSVKKIHGVKSANVSFANSSGEFVLDSSDVLEDVIKKIKSLGFGVVKNYQELEDYRKLHIKNMIFKFVISAILSCVIMSIEMFLTPNLWLNLIMLTLSSVVVFYCGGHFFIHAKKSLRNLNFDMNVLISLGVMVAYLYSLFVVVVPDFIPQNLRYLYFSSSAMIITFVTLGKFLEERSKLKASDYLKNLIDLAPKKALKVSKGAQLEEVNADELKKGDIVIVKSGFNIPCDGVIIEGGGDIDKSFLSGESLPVYHSKGDNVYAGCVNLDGYMTIEVTKEQNNTMIYQILNLMSEASSKKMPIARLADKVANIFVPSVILIAIFTLIFWSLNKDLSLGLILAASVLIISCPCALGLATPIAIVCALGAGAKRGILIKNPEVLENMQDIRFGVFDKTGTLSKGEISVKKSLLSDQILSFVASIEERSEHPISKAIVEYSKNNCMCATKFNGEHKNIPGKGIIASQGNINIMIGNLALMQENGVYIRDDILEEINKITNDGFGVVMVAYNSNFSGYLVLSDSLKDGAKELILELKKMDITPIMLTGDSLNVAKYIANQIDIQEIHAELLPQDKYEFVEKLKQKGKVLFVGDGINDAPSLKSADISVAMSSGSDIAKESGDIVVVNSDLKSILTFIKLTKETMKTIKQNLFWAFIYNAICIPIAAGVLYPFGFILMPMYGAIAMSISSISVVLNSIKLRFMKFENKI
ncbi:heavy metal translocating P-type ATPase [Campylobacter sputorum]|uniref:heavy metal translocating P-type ATPase n=1 Tax=Campylobacter sputorum TaxID=206 RepID=UPI00053BE4E4|nr:cation-translocating P-type ATPase [Campylobacter sputorum]